MDDPQIIFRVHAIQQMAARGISEIEVRTVLEAHDVVEDYPNDLPFPAQLLLGWIDKRPLHVVASFDRGHRIFVVTVYEPSLDEWELGYRRRRIK